MASRLRAYAQLLRIPNVFTAMADVVMGWMASRDWPVGDGQWAAYSALALLVGSSSCLYLAGMVLNDFFDVEQDRRERPFRPIPSGRVARRTAAGLGIGLLASGVALSGLAATDSLICATMLAACILLYDGGLKRTPLGPVAMGTCRYFNVLLGMTAGGLWPSALNPAMAVGVYIVGVTWFARTEAGESRRAALLASSMVMLLGVILGAVTVFQAQGIASDGEPRAGNERLLFLGLLVAWAGVTGRPVLAAIAQPHPVRVQEAVKRCILGLIGLDALIAFGLIGWPGLLILLLLPPALLLGRWVYST